MSGVSTTTRNQAFRGGHRCGCLNVMSTSQDYPHATPRPASTTAGDGQRRGPSLRDISQQQANAATQYMIDELMSQGMSEKEAIEHLEREVEKAIPDDFWDSGD